MTTFELASRMLDMLERVEWVKRAGGTGYCCPFCHAISERDGGPGHVDECEWRLVIDIGNRKRAGGVLR